MTIQSHAEQQFKEQKQQQKEVPGSNINREKKNIICAEIAVATIAKIATR